MIKLKIKHLYPLILFLIFFLLLILPFTWTKLYHVGGDDSKLYYLFPLAMIFGLMSLFSAPVSLILGQFTNENTTVAIWTNNTEDAGGVRTVNDISSISRHIDISYYINICVWKELI